MCADNKKNLDLTDNFGDTLRSLRRQKRLSQAALAKSLGISQGYLSDLEAGKKYPSDTLLIALHSRYGDTSGASASGAAGPGSAAAGAIPLLGKIDPRLEGSIPGLPVATIRLPQLQDGHFALLAVGNFMAPTICSGDLVILQPATAVDSGEIALLTNQWGEAILRRFRVKGAERIFTPDNSSYKPFHPDSDTRVLARVVAVWRSVLH